MIYSDCRIFKYHRNILQPLQVHLFLQGERNRPGLQELEGDEVVGEVLAEFEAEHLAGLRTGGAVLLSDRHVDLLDENLGVQVLCQNQSSVYSIAPVLIAQTIDALEI